MMRRQAEDDEDDESCIKPLFSKTLGEKTKFVFSFAD
jgi:hypothetical protein